jgi:hypothetical protein
MKSSGSSLITSFVIDFGLGIRGQPLIRTIKVRRSRTRLVAELRRSDSLDNQCTHEFRGCVHFEAAIKDQAELALLVEPGPINDSLLRIDVANPIKARDLPCLSSGPATR